MVLPQADVGETDSSAYVILAGLVKERTHLESLD